MSSEACVPWKMHRPHVNELAGNCRPSSDAHVPGRRKRRISTARAFEGFEEAALSGCGIGSFLVGGGGVSGLLTGDAGKKQGNK